MTHGSKTAEATRLEEDSRRTRNWKRWGPYLAERQWGTVREDYSADGECWEYFPHDHARSRVYRWGEDGLLGICDREARLCFALALWNGRDPLLKERLFGVSGKEGNHGEDVKEHYFYLESSPTHSYMKSLYKYPQAEFPYAQLVQQNSRRGRGEPEFELSDTGVFDKDRYFDVLAEYAKAGPDDILIRMTISNRGPDAASIHVLPTLWFRNTWSWGRTGEGYWPKGTITLEGDRLVARHATLGTFRLSTSESGVAPGFLFTENETNSERLFGVPGRSRYYKDAFHERVVGGRVEAVNPDRTGSKAAIWYGLEIPAGQSYEIRLRLTGEAEGSGSIEPLGVEFERLFAARIREMSEYFGTRTPGGLSSEQLSIVRQGYAGLLHTKQFYHYVIKDWLDGDPAQPPPPPERRLVRNRDWPHIYNRDIISMPDKWEYPWYAAWDLAFHMIPFAKIDPSFAKEQLVLFLREWYMHANGQLPAYEFALHDVNPPVHAWAAWRVYKIAGEKGHRDRVFLARVFQKLLINFTWWVNRKDVDGKNLFTGGFLGLDNIGVFDRSRPLPADGHLEQADGTAWMAFYCLTMLAMALELAREEPEYEDLASKFFEHFIAISDAMNTLGGSGLWDEHDGFYYDQLHADGVNMPLRVRSMVGLVPLFAVEILEEEILEKLPGFLKRMRWFVENRKDLARHISCMTKAGGGQQLRLLAIPSKERLTGVLRYLLDESEFLSPHGIRSLSRVHMTNPYTLNLGGTSYSIAYEPGEARTGLFGGNSNWRGPVWFPVNYLIIEALERYHHFYGDTLKVECPTGSGRMMNLAQVAREISSRLAKLFLPDENGRRPCHGDDRRFARNPGWRELVLFHEYFDGETGRGCGASHQTGWTALAIRCIEDLRGEDPR